METKNSQSDVDVFEMILDSSGGLGPAPVSARPSAKHVEEDWHSGHEEGQLAVDVAEKKTELVVISTMAGADPSKIEVYVHSDLLTIRGVRSRPLKDGDDLNYFHEECYWGKFSRTVVLPVDVRGDGARAEYKNGILVVRIPKRKSEARIQVKVVEE